MSNWERRRKELDDMLGQQQQNQFDIIDKINAMPNWVKENFKGYLYNEQTLILMEDYRKEKENERNNK